MAVSLPTVGNGSVITSSTFRLIVTDSSTDIFLYRLGGVESVIRALENKFTADRRIALNPWPLPATAHGLVIERMQFVDGRYTGNEVEGTFGHLKPAAES